MTEGACEFFKFFSVIPCHSHTFPVETPGAAMFCLSGMQLMWPTKASFVRSHWLAHLQLLLAADCSEGGSQGRRFLLHVLINLEVSEQTGHFWRLSAAEGWVELKGIYRINAFWFFFAARKKHSF